MEESVIKHKDTVKKYSRIKSIIMVLVLTEIIVFALISYLSVKDFTNNGVKVLSSRIQEHSKPLLNQVISDLPKKISVVGPKFLETVASKLTDDLPEIHKVYMSEMNQLESYGNSTKKVIENEMNSFIENQRESVKVELKNIFQNELPEEEINKIVQNYMIVLEKKINMIVAEKMEKHLILGDRIMNSCKKLSSNPEVSNLRANPQHILGLGLELLGNDLLNN